MMTAVLAALFVAAPPEATTKFALVVGHNRALTGSEYEPLRYADDDAVRFASFLRTTGAHVELLVYPDDETRARFDGALAHARPPTRNEVFAAIDRLERALEQAEGREREVFVYFAGHGTMTSANAYLHLLDAPFTRTDLYSQIIRRLPRERMHIIVDSCHAYFLVNARGNRVRVTSESMETLRAHPDVGLLLSTSDRKEVHEWDGYRAGVFSYQLLGALQGAADVDTDGVVTYDEVRAYIAAANLRVQNPRARIRPFVRAPRLQQPHVVDLRHAEPGMIEVPPAMAGRMRVLDRHGYPLLDANKPAGLAMSILLPERVVPHLDVDSATHVVERDADGRRRFAATPVSTASSAVASRGIVDDEFRRNLFQQPLTQDFVAGVRAANGSGTLESTHTVERPWHEDRWVVGLFAAGATGIVAGAVFTGLHAAARSDLTSASGDEYDNTRTRAESFRVAMGIGYAAGGALVTAAVLKALFGAERQATTTMAVTFAPEEGAALSWTGRF